MQVLIRILMILFTCWQIFCIWGKKYLIMNDFKWGIVGTGEIAKAFVADMKLVKDRNHKVVAVMGTSMESAGNFAKEHQAERAYESIHEMVKEGGIDGVYIASPHPFHHKETIICLEHKIPVLCEKPLAMNAGQVSEIIEASRNNETRVMEGMWIRYLPSIKKMLDLYNSGKIGDAIHLNASMSYVAPKDKENRFYNENLGGGSLMDLGIYPVYLATLLFGKPASLQAFAKLTDDNIDEYCQSILRFPDNKFAYCESSIITKTANTAVITGTKGRITIQEQWNEKPPAIVIEYNEGDPETVTLDWEGRGFQYEIEAFTNYIFNKEDGLLHSIDDSLQLMQVLDDIRDKSGIEYPFDKDA